MSMNKRFDNSVPWQQAPAQETTTRVPARAASFQSDVLTPLGQAVITTLPVGVAIWLLATALVNMVRTWLGYDPATSWLALGAVLLVVFIITWVVLLFDHRRLLWALERATHIDLNRDGHKGEPKQILGVSVQDGETTHFWDSDWLEMSDDELTLFAFGLRRLGRKLTEKEWGKDKRVFPRGLDHFREVRGKLVVAGAIRKGPGQTSTFELTHVGEIGFDRILESAES